MNYYSVTINLKTSEQNLPWYIIEQSITKEGKYLRQSCCPGMFAIITLRIEPDPVKQVAVFEKKNNRNRFRMPKNVSFTRKK